MKEKVMNGLEKFSKAMLSPLSYISAAGLCWAHCLPAQALVR